MNFTAWACHRGISLSGLGPVCVDEIAKAHASAARRRLTMIYITVLVRARPQAPVSQAVAVPLDALAALRQYGCTMRSQHVNANANASGYQDRAVPRRAHGAVLD